MRSAVKNFMLISSLALTANSAFADRGGHHSNGHPAGSGYSGGSASNSASSPSLPVPSALIPLGFCLSALALKRARRFY